MDEVVLAVQQGTVPFDVIAPQYSELIYSVIHRHMKQVDGCDIGDLYNAGLLGLYEAFKTFDFNVGTKFTTYSFVSTGSTNMKLNSSLLETFLSLLIELIDETPLIILNAAFLSSNENIGGLPKNVSASWSSKIHTSTSLKLSHNILISSTSFALNKS